MRSFTMGLPCWSAFMWTLAALLLSGCAVPRARPSVDPQLQEQARVSEHVQAADKAQQQGHTDRALAQLDAAIDIDPASKWPWIKKAQLHLDARQYGAAINAAQEALQRDVKDPTAHAILALSGLRVSAQALAQLHAMSEMPSSTRSEAEGLATLIHDTLGDAASMASVARVETVSRPKAQAVRGLSRAAVPPSFPSMPSSNGRSNPFGALQ